ncbi:Phosphatidylinositol-glycan-specific phospholipase D [Yarrowia sp. C11]|nr:Phosphatidylinositol-glycan-specific phospholipase D [Yarrowia sp. E02]KAG5372678.1 Phosphatidylinositol-glycan-specific phospholipase D [Yarrowia sp. C11]
MTPIRAILAWILAANAAAAGIGVHLTLLSRTLPSLLSHLPNKQTDQYLQPGAFFPDCFYNCLGLSEEAEDAHWPPFLAAGVNYWRSRYGHLADYSDHNDPTTDPPTDSEFKNSLRLKAFLMGVLTHQIADVSWHSLGFRQGFLDMLKERDFEGDVERAHEALDVGGDMILMSRLLSADPDLDWLEIAWDIPFADISEIYKSIGSFVSKREIEYCMVQGKAALKAEKRFSGAGFRRYASLSPVLFSELETYYLGGIQEIAATIEHCIGTFSAWFRGKHDISPSESWKVCEAFIGKSREQSDDSVATVHGLNFGLYRNIGSLEARLRNSMSTDLLVRFHKTKGLLAFVKQSFLTMLPEVVKTPKLKIESEAPQNEIFLSPLQHGSYFGSSIMLGEFDGIQETWIAVSAPFEQDSGSVYVMALDQFKETAATEPSEFVKLEDDDINDDLGTLSSVYSGPSRFGAALASIKSPVLANDILVVSSPGRNKLVFHYKGRKVMVLKSEPPSEYGSSGTKQMGETLLVTSDYLIVGSPRTDVDKPQRGKVEFLSIAKIIEEIRAALAIGFFPTLAYDSFVVYTLDPPADVINRQDRLRDDMLETEEVGYELFGATLAALNDTIFVGVPGAVAVVAYRYTEWGDKWTPSYILRGDKDSSKESSFGGDFIETIPETGIIIIGSSTESESASCLQSGVVYIFQENAGKASFVTKIHSIKTSNNMCEPFSRFATSAIRPMAWQDAKLVSSPSSYIYIGSPFAYNNRGAVWRLDLNNWEVIEVPVQGHGRHPASQFATCLAVLETTTSGALSTIAAGMPFAGIHKLGEARAIDEYSPLSGGLYLVYV